MDLTSAPFLFLDGQTTGLSPRNAELIEIGWSASCDAKEIETKLLKPQDLAGVPRVVWSMTGIDPAELAAAESPQVVWRRIVEERAEARAAIIHYSQFETPFLRALHREVFGEDAELPWPIVCTYRVAKRLHHDLPARSIRALSGHFGHVLPERHRAEEHVAATQTIWRHLLESLKEREGISTWEDFLAWWSKPPAPAKKSSARKYLVARAKRLDLPDEPGVYEMHARDGQILYIGKATSLHSRVNSYFRQRKTTRARLKELMTQVAEVRVTPTATPLEAALLENDRIKEIDPRYNYSLREHARRLWFVSPCLTHFSQTRDEEHPWGPFTSHEIFDSLASLLLIQRGEHDQLDPFLLHHPPEIMKEKLETFLASIGYADLSTLTLTDLLRAARFAKEISPADDTEDEALLAEASVHRKLRRARRCLHQAHWLAWLTESRVFWEVPEKGFRVLEIRGGRIASARYQITPPSPTTYARSKVPLKERQRRLDLVTYDRMRILGTELSGIAKRTPITVQYSSTRVFHRILSHTKGETA